VEPPKASKWQPFHSKAPRPAFSTWGEGTQAWGPGGNRLRRPTGLENKFIQGL